MFGTAISFFVMVHGAIKITFREKKIVAENRDINSKLKKNRDSYFSPNRAGLVRKMPWSLL